MKEYIAIPEYFSQELVKSKILHNFLKDAEYIGEKKIKLQSLRKFYSRNSKKGLQLIDELKMRGFKFIVSSPSKILFTFKNSSKIELLYTNEDNNKIEKLNKKIFSFIDYRDNITSDFYFNLIPIYAFKNVMKDFNYSLVKQEFTRYGYKIISEEYLNEYVLPSKNNQYRSIVRKNTEESIILPRINYNLEIKLIIKSIINRNPNYKDRILNIKLVDILPDRLSAEKLIKNKLIKDEIYTLNELIEYDINRLHNIRGVGTKSILEFKKLITKSIKNIDKVDYTKIEINKNEEINRYIKYLIEENNKYMYMFKYIKIDKILPDNTKTDKLILKRFENDEIISIYDLLYYDMEIIKDIRGVGVKKFNDVIKKIKEKIDKEKLKFDEMQKGMFFLKGWKFESFKDCKIKEVHTMLYGDDIQKYVDINDIYIYELQGIEYSCFDDYNIVFYLNKLLMDLNEVTNINAILKKSLPSNISKRDKKIMYQRIINEKTLEKVGSNFGLSRERVRQIEKRILNIYTLNLKRNKFCLSLKLNFNNKKFFYIKDFIDLLDKENHYIINIIMSGGISNLNYYELLERVYLEPINHFDTELKEILELIPDFGETEEDLGAILEFLDELFLDIDYGEGIKILEENNINVKGSFYFKQNLNNKTMLHIIFKYIHKSQIVLDDEGAEIINKYTSDIFGLQIENSARNWQGIISTIDDVILVNPRTYIHIDHIPIDIEVIKKLKNILDEELLESKYVYSERLFERMNLEQNDNNLISKHHVYSLIKYYYSEYYQTSTGNSLQISKIGTPQVTNSEYIYDIVFKAGGIMRVDKIKEDIRWSDHVIEMAIINNDKMIKIGSQKCAIIELLFKNDELFLFRKILKDDMKEGYTTSSKFYYKLLFDNNMSIFLDRNRITDGKQLAGLMKYFDKNIDGHNVFMYYKNSNIRSIEDVIYHFYPRKVSRYDISQILLDLKIKDTSILSIVDKLLSSKRYVQISREEYINYNDFSIDKSLKEKLLLYFNKVYKKDGFIVPEDHINKIKSMTNYTNYIWNQYIISTVLVENGYKKLTRFNSDYRYEILVLVRKDYKYEDISYLIYNLIKNEYKGNLHEEHVYEFLSEKGIYRREDDRSKKKLEIDAKRNELITVDIVGNITLKE